MSDLERQIDELYQRHLGEFTSARNGLAKALSSAGAKADAARVKALNKPTLVPWAVNQVYWRARSIWNRLIASGQSLRASQLATLAGPGTAGKPSRGPGRAGGAGPTGNDLEGAHRRAVADAVHQAVRTAADAGLHPAVDQVTRMLEAISLAASLPEPAGRLTEVVQPAGFEALLGVPIAPPTPPGAGVDSSRARGSGAKAVGSTSGSPKAQTQAVDTARLARRAAAVAARAQALRREEAARLAEAAAAQAVHDAELRATQARAALHDARTATRAAVAAREEAECALAELDAADSSS